VLADIVSATLRNITEYQMKCTSNGQAKFCTLFGNIENHTHIKVRAGHQYLEIHPTTSEIYIRNVYATYFMEQRPREELIFVQVAQRSQNLMDSEDSLLYPQSPARFHILNHTDQVNAIQFWIFQFHFNIVLPYNLGFQVVSILHASQQKFKYFFFPSQCVPHAPHPHFMLFDCVTYFHPKSIWWGIQSTKLLTFQFRPASRYFLSLSYKYFP
jgi:hypothetical protein